MTYLQLSHRTNGQTTHYIECACIYNSNRRVLPFAIGWLGCMISPAPQGFAVPLSEVLNINTYMTQELLKCFKQLTLQIPSILLLLR